VDGSLFHPAEGRRERRIGYLARSRRSAERDQLLHILRSRGVLADWELTPISGTEAETARLMRSCPIFLSFGFREGFGLPPAEAMASGCYVVGYTALGGTEYFDPAYCTPVAECDLVAYGEAVEEAMQRFQDDPDAVETVGLKSSAAILDRYSADNLTADLSRFYDSLSATA
jgi:glycosyltransferase involved in cell wall biosynthesis